MNHPATHIIFGLLIAILPYQAIAKELKTPLSVGGMTLGSNVADYSDIEHSNFLKEITVNDWNGFRKGIISYGICDSPGEIVKIRMKYYDNSKKFYKKLLKKFRSKFGKPDEWKGDAFGVLYIWKWHFKDDQGNRVTLVLQHNTKNPDQNIGNVVKLSYPDKIVVEQICFNKQCEERNGGKGIKKSTELDWNSLIPR